MPYERREDIPKNLGNLSLKQANYWSKIYDALQRKEYTKEFSAMIAWTLFKKRYNKTNKGSWKLKKKPKKQLNEVSQIQLTRKSYKDTPERKERAKEYNYHFFKLGTDGFRSKKRYLDMYFSVHRYVVGIRYIQFKTILRKYYKQYKDIKKAVNRTIRDLSNKVDVQVSCSCPDFKYRFAYMASKNLYKLGQPETRPAKIRNPTSKGGLCKHLIAVMEKPSKWTPKVITAVNKEIKKDSGIVTGRYKKK